MAHLIPNNVCSSEFPNNCLAKTSYIATRGDGRKVRVEDVYDYKEEDSSVDIFDPRNLVPFMKYLRNEYEANPEYGSQLYNQIDFIVSKAVDRNGALVWENPTGLAQGMHQAELACFLSSAANAFNHHSDRRSAKGIMTYALKLLRSLDIQAGVHTGGVCSFGSPRPARLRQCYWFHSHISDPVVSTVLNQHLHVIRDVLYTYLNIIGSGNLIDEQFGSLQDVLDYLEDKAIGGLNQLAFSEGNNEDFPNRPPNIKQFMNRRTVSIKASPEHPDGNPLSYYWAYYGYDMTEHQGNDIKPHNVCHYHTHVVELMAHIILVLNENKTIFEQSNNGHRLYEAMGALLQGKGEPTGMEGSTNAFYQFYRSEGPAYKRKRQGCTGRHLNSEIVELYSSLFD